MRNATLLLAVFIWLSGCAPAPPAAEVDHREEALAAVRAGEAAMAKAFAAKDGAAAVANYAPNAAIMAANVPFSEGTEAVAGLWKEMAADPNFALKGTPQKFEASKSGDLGYARGTYEITMTDPKTKKPVTEKGKYITIYAKQADGAWKIIEDINTPDGPAK